MTTTLPVGPDPAAIIDHITTTFPETAVLEAGGTWFCSLDAERHFPNFATIVTTNDFDDGSDLDRDGVFRLNLGVDRATFEGFAFAADPDVTVLDTILPHPTYAAQRWICILNPSWTTWHEVIVPLVALAHDRLAAQRARHG